MINVIKILLRRVDEYSLTLFLSITSVQLNNFLFFYAKNLPKINLKLTISDCYITLISVPKKTH